MNYNLEKYHWKNIIIPICFFTIVLLIPNINVNLDVSLYLTVVSLLFTILIGFFIGASTTNYLRLQTLVSQEDGGLMAIYNLAVLMSPKSKEQITKAVDNYMITALNFAVTDYIDKTQKEFHWLVKVVNSIETVTAPVIALLPYIQTELNLLFKVRQEVTLVSRRIVGKSHWAILILLAGLIDILLFSMKRGDFLSNFTTAILILSTYLILMLLYEVDNNHFWEEKLAYVNSEKVFDLLEIPRYYPEEAFKLGRVKKPNQTYRLGNIKSEKNLEDREIILVNL